MKITLLGNPISTNLIYKSTCQGGFAHVYMSKEGKDLKEDYQLQIKSQYKQEIIYKPVELDIKLYFKDNRKRDWDNYHKLSMDALSGIVFEDDKLIKKAVVEKFVDKENPRIEINLNIL